MELTDSKILVAHKYAAGVYTLHDVFKLVTIKYLTEEEFHWITGYSYQGLKESKGW